jgi:hypothetical protein
MRVEYCERYRLVMPALHSFLPMETRMALASQMIHGLQAQSRDKQATKPSPASQCYVHFFNQGDRRHVSAYSLIILREMCFRARVPDVWITSTVRDTREQAAVMLHNIVQGKDIHYRAAGASVQKIAQTGVKEHWSEAEILAAMEMQINKVGLGKVTHHAAQSGLNTVDLSVKKFAGSGSTGGYHRFIAIAKDFVAGRRIKRCGWPEGPVSTGALFNDKGCIHLEIPQPPIIDDQSKPTAMFA